MDANAIHFSQDPLETFHAWLRLAGQSEPNDPNAAALATATAQGRPSVRMVLIKQADTNGFRFFTNAQSQKGRELAENPWASLCMHWKSLRRQIRVEGPVTSLSDEESDQYFHSRSRRSQIAAAVSLQSERLDSRGVLERSVEEFTASHGGAEIPRPDFWRGYVLKAQSIEFWSDGPDRLHSRTLFTRNGDVWESALLYP
jgi:pyridoxamine 5'-phosphate oxidase